MAGDNRKQSQTEHADTSQAPCRCYPRALLPPLGFHHAPSPGPALQDPAWKPDAYEPEAEQKKDAAWVEGRSAEELEEGEDDAAFVDDRFMAEYRCAARLAGWPAGPAHGCAARQDCHVKRPGRRRRLPNTLLFIDGAAAPPHPPHPSLPPPPMQAEAAGGAAPGRRAPAVWQPGDDPAERVCGAGDERPCRRLGGVPPVQGQARLGGLGWGLGFAGQLCWDRLLAYMCGADVQAGVTLRPGVWTASLWLCRPRSVVRG